jgi:hypothetical protein
MASPLSLLMPVVPGTDPMTMAQDLAQFQQELTAALQSIGTVHYARSLVLNASKANLQPGLPPYNPKDSFLIAIITEFDGSFDAYISDFCAKAGDAFNGMLKFVVGGEALIPVQDNVAAFGAFIATNNASQQVPNNGPMFQAYPWTVQLIKAKMGS